MRNYFSLLQPEVSSPVEVKKKSVKLSRVVSPLLEQVGLLRNYDDYYYVINIAT